MLRPKRHRSSVGRGEAVWEIVEPFVTVTNQFGGQELKNTITYATLAQLVEQRICNA